MSNLTKRAMRGKLMNLDEGLKFSCSRVPLNDVFLSEFLLLNL